MKKRRFTHSLWMSIFYIFAVAFLVQAQEVLPNPPAPFKGKIGLSYKDSKLDFPQPVHAPKGSANILLVMLNDVGYGASSTFGGPINTPTLERLAKNGLKYTNFHTRALCSPNSSSAPYGKKSSLGSYRSDYGRRNRLPRLRFAHGQGYGLPVEWLTGSVFNFYAWACGTILARAHARTSDPARIAGYWGNSKALDEALSEWAEAYADQTERDHATLLDAIRHGEVVADLSEGDTD
jgi:hypothetical protein